MKLQQDKITFDAVMHVQSSERPRRICFATFHSNALKPSIFGEYVGKFKIPFKHTIYPIFYKITGIKLRYDQKYKGYWTPLTSIKYNFVEEFVSNSGELVYLRDTLSLSLAICDCFDNEKNRTKIGELKHNAKYKNNKDALNKLATRCCELIQKLPFYNEATTVCAVPSSKNTNNNLPGDIVNIIAENTDIDDISKKVRWTKDKHSLKDVPLKNKWQALETAGLEVNADLKGKTIILLDDLYQSGITMQFVAMKLQEAGAAFIYGLAVCKSRRDSDNQ